MATPAQQTINITDLDIPQLADVKKQLEEEINHLTNSFAQLKQAQAKFKNCVDNVAELTPQSKGKTILVPLTTSLYVPGKLSNPEHVIVDVGTGYFVQNTRPQALKHYKSKIDYLKLNLDVLQDTIQKKQDNLGMLINILQSKITARQQQQTSSSVGSNA